MPMAWSWYQSPAASCPLVYWYVMDSPVLKVFSVCPSNSGRTTAPCRWTEVRGRVRSSSVTPSSEVSMSLAKRWPSRSLVNVRFNVTPDCASMVGPRYDCPPYDQVGAASRSRWNLWLDLAIDMVRSPVSTGGIGRSSTYGVRSGEGKVSWSPGEVDSAASPSTVAP